jgi:prephenate dehydrogenase
MTIGIIGFGRFGTLAASVLKKHATVHVYDKKKQLAKARRIGVKFSQLKTVAGSDIVILSVPISQTEKVLRQIAKLIKPGALVVDTCSVKVYPCHWLKKYLPKNVDILGTHPMFGPITTNFNESKQTCKLQDLQIVLCPLRIKEKRLLRIKKFLKQLGLQIIVTTPQEHDKQNAITLSFVHFLGRSLWETGIREQKMYSPGFKDLLSIYRTTTDDSWELFYDMNIYNPYASKTRIKFMQTCQRIEKKIENKNNKARIGK